MKYKLTHLEDYYIYDVFYHIKNKLLVIVMAGCIHTINDMDEETENVTYTTPEPYIIHLQENDNFRMFTVTSCIRESLIHKP